MNRQGDTTSYRIPELLAPVGGWPQFRAAVNNGADAVYLGGSRFNARGRADNFTKEDMKRVCALAHERNVKVYVTFNTLLKDAELPQALDYAGFLYEAGADAVILQDMGLAKLIRKTLPDLSLHLSTQATVYNGQAVDLMKRWGFSRIVPARELTLEEIRAFTAACHGEPFCEVEVFVHGALCMCYSGQCQMSRVLGLSGGSKRRMDAGTHTGADGSGPSGGGRSANRGFCAQPCRLPYTDDRGNTTYLLSPKDLCLLEELPALCEAGVDSLKIEGRLKSPEYVTVTTSIYRKYLDAYAEAGRIDVDPKDLAALRQIYSRGAFTTGYLYENPGEGILSGDLPKHTGIRIGAVKTVLDGAAPAAKLLKDRAVSSAVRGAVKKGACLIEASLTGSLQEGDGIEIRRAGGPGKAADPDRISGNIVTYLKPLKGGFALIGDIKGRARPGDQIFRISDRTLMESARETFDSDEQQELDRRMRRKVPVDVYFKAAAGEVPVLKMRDGSFEAEARADLPAELAVNRPSDPKRVEQQLRKLGNTPFQIREASILLDGTCVVPVSELNRMRREAVQKLLEQKRDLKRPPVGGSLKAACRQLAQTAEHGGDLSAGRARAAEIWNRAVPLEQWLQGDDGIPHVFPITKGRLDALLESRFEEIAQRARQTGIILENPGWMLRFLDAGVRVYGGPGLNVYNREAEAAYRELGAEVIAWSWEQALPGEQAAAPDMFDGIPLMITEHPVQSKTLTDRKGVVHRVGTAPSGDKTIIY